MYLFFALPCSEKTTGIQFTAINLKTMLYLDIPRLIKERGITNPAGFMRNNNISPEVWRYIKLTERSTISMALMEKLCLAFNCSPDDLFSWSGKIATMPDYEKHPLQKLRRDDSGSIFEKLAKLPAIKIDKLRHMVDELAKEE